MKKYLSMIITAVACIALSVLGFALGGVALSELQTNILIVLLIVMGVGVLYCFIVGEITHNNSQMDKIWSVFPIIYVWIIAIMGGMHIRLIAYALVVTVWGVRLTINFARKGAYKLKFWEGEEDYRWALLREKKIFQSRLVWGAFDFAFISLYQNFLVLAMVFPMLATVGSTANFSIMDFIATFLACIFLVIETVSDEEQWKFQETKKKLLAEGKSLEELPYPYNLGFNTTYLWGFMRHPNYLAEQAIWVCLYLHTIGAGVTNYGIFNWSMFGPLLIILLFLGSSNFGEKISASKYPKYEHYQKTVFKYLPIRKYKDQ